uniref:Uncharacterized protein n=1 Tax=Arundo donax TaxID=35708 RepID=A0A0A9DXM3_ARUDO
MPYILRRLLAAHATSLNSSACSQVLVLLFPDHPY